MFLISSRTAFLKPVLALVMLGSSLLSNSAQASGSTDKGNGKNKKGRVEKIAVPAAKAVATAPIVVAPMTLTLTGRVRNEQGQPLAGATVMVPGSDLAVSTDAQGNFALEVPAVGEKTLRYGYGGYQDRDVIVSTSAPFTMSLHPSTTKKKHR